MIDRCADCGWLVGLGAVENDLCALVHSTGPRALDAPPPPRALSPAMDRCERAAARIFREADDFGWSKLEARDRLELHAVAADIIREELDGRPTWAQVAWSLACAVVVGALAGAGSVLLAR